MSLESFSLLLSDYMNLGYVPSGTNVSFSFTATGDSFAVSFSVSSVGSLASERAFGLRLLRFHRRTGLSDYALDELRSFYSCQSVSLLSDVLLRIFSAVSSAKLRLGSVNVLTFDRAVPICDCVPRHSST